ncbi:MAG TPA: DUF6294 family protein [Nonomuraea sp.]|nr:DUF6294 family protein [Nonomuraea sp.]
MNTIRKMAGAAAATALLAAGLAISTTAGAHAQTGADPKTFYWDNPQRAGDCTMFEGATWTLYPNGTAYFDAVVTSSDDGDAWLMWARLKDANGAVLGALSNPRIQDPVDRAKFVKNLPSHTQRYRWFASGSFNPNLFSLIKRMSLSKHC